MTNAARATWIVRIPTPIWLLALVVVAFGANWLMAVPVLFRYKPAGIALMLLGLVVSASGRLAFRRQGAEIIPSSDIHSALVAIGPFRFTRNPMYLGMIVIGTGAALTAGTWLMWLVPILIFVLDNYVIIPYEEASMERAFGEDYREYKAQVRRWL
jgi:protein-S-isoprenylcysteine O-methyltransferase Ste14